MKKQVCGRPAEAVPMRTEDGAMALDPKLPGSNRNQSNDVMGGEVGTCAMLDVHCLRRVVEGKL